MSVFTIISFSVNPLYVKDLVGQQNKKNIKNNNHLIDRAVFKSDDIQIIDSNDSFIDIITSDNIRKRIDYEKYMEYKNKKNQEKYNESNKIQHDHNEKEDIQNILLVGIDSRRKDFKNGRADAIIIVSVNKSKKEIKLISVMRDLYVKIPGYKNNRINATYNYGGAELLKRTINTNFNLNLDKYVVVDFAGFEKVINALGGLNINVKKYEINEMNRCIAQLKANKDDYIRKSGENDLNGTQVLAYCRIRKVGNDDYERTERQRTVMKLMIEKITDLPLTRYPNLIASIYQHVKTNLTIKESMDLAKDYYNVGDWRISGIQIPTKESGQPRKIDSMWVVYPNVSECISIIKEFTGDNK